MLQCSLVFDKAWLWICRCLYILICILICIFKAFYSKIGFILKMNWREIGYRLKRRFLELIPFYDGL